MSESYIQSLFAERIGGTGFGSSENSYKFAKIKEAKVLAQQNKSNIQLIDMGVGEPDEMAYPEVVRALSEEASKRENRFYADNGGVPFTNAVANFMKEHYSVVLDPKTELLHSMGSKAALSILPKCFINRGDYIISTTPGYPVFPLQTKYLGGIVYELPLIGENDFLPDLSQVPTDILQKTKVLVLNYPNNPTGAVATIDFYKKVIAWAKQNNVIVVQDAAYSNIVFKEPPISILQVPGAKDIAVELHSLSKAFNMTGWRIGWVCGNKDIVKAYGAVKNNTDSGQFLAIQCAAVKALKSPYIIDEINQKYARRMDLLTEALIASGFPARKSPGTFFLYVKSPNFASTNEQKATFYSAEEFSHWLIKNELISTVPWDQASPHIRFSVTFSAKNETEEISIISEVKKRLSKYKFGFN